MKCSSMSTGELKEEGFHFLLHFPLKVPAPESSDIIRKFGHWIIYYMNPIAASPDWREVIRGHPEAARRAVPFGHGSHPQLRPQGAFLQVPSIALQLMSETPAKQPPLLRAPAALGQPRQHQSERHAALQHPKSSARTPGSFRGWYESRGGDMYEFMCIYVCMYVVCVCVHRYITVVKARSSVQLVQPPALTGAARRGRKRQPPAFLDSPAHKSCS